MGMGFGSVAAAAMLQSEQATAAPILNAVPKAKSVIWLFMIGGASHLETFDPKPDAPEEVRGPLETITTNVTGVRIGECLERIAKMMDKLRKHKGRRQG